MSKTYELRPTSNAAIMRVVDRKGDWQHYFHVPSSAYLRGATTILSRGYAKPELFEWAKNHTRDEIDAKVRAAGDKGDAIHQYIALILAGVFSSGQVDRSLKVLAENNKDLRVLTDDEWDAVLSFGRFWAAHTPKLIASEYTVFNLPDGYAGTLDAIIRMTKSCGFRCCNCKRFIGVPVLVDWKSGGGIYESFGAQVASYAVAIATMPEDPLSSVELGGTGIVRLGTSHVTSGGFQCEFYDMTESEVHWREFVAAKTIDDATYRPFEPEKEIRDIPDSLAFTLEREGLTKPKNPALPERKPPAAGSPRSQRLTSKKEHSQVQRKTARVSKKTKKAA